MGIHTFPASHVKIEACRGHQRKFNPVDKELPLQVVSRINSMCGVCLYWHRVIGQEENTVDNVVCVFLKLLHTTPRVQNIDFLGGAHDGCMGNHACPIRPNIGGLQPAVDKPRFNPVPQRRGVDLAGGPRRLLCWLLVVVQ